MVYELKVVRFGLYPADEPTGYAVGFTAQAANGRSVYRDTVVPLSDAKDLKEEDIVNLAWVQLGPGIEQEMETLSAKSALIGQVFEPSVEAKAAVEEVLTKK